MQTALKHQMPLISRVAAFCGGYIARFELYSVDERDFEALAAFNVVYTVDEKGDVESASIGAALFKNRCGLGLLDCVRFAVERFEMVREIHEVQNLRRGA